jgi:hypothetical protein
MVDSRDLIASAQAPGAHVNEKAPSESQHPVRVGAEFHRLERGHPPSI